MESKPNKYKCPLCGNDSVIIDLCKFCGKIYLTKIYKKDSKVHIKNVCTQELIDAFRKIGFQVDIIKEITKEDDRYF